MAATFEAYKDTLDPEFAAEMDGRRLRNQEKDLGLTSCPVGTSQAGTSQAGSSSQPGML